MVALAAFLSPVAPASPSGKELRHDPRFLAIGHLLEPASRRVRAETPDSDPRVDWDEVLRQAEALAAEGRDLRLLVIIGRALVNLRGFDGAAESFALLARTLDEYWDSLHPALRDRPTLREAAFGRVSALAQIENGEDGVLCDLQHMSVVVRRGVGRVSGADLAAASLSPATLLAEEGEGLGDAEKARLAADHEARAARVRLALRALRGEEPARLAALAASVEAARVALVGLEASLAARLAGGGGGGGVAYGALQRFLTRAASTLRAAEQGAGQAEGAAALAPAGGPAAASAGPGVIASRADVERALDRIVAFYEATEPASPIPLLLRRVRRMVPMTFLQLMEEMAPSGMKEVRNLAGVADEKKS